MLKINLNMMMMLLVGLEIDPPLPRGKTVLHMQKLYTSLLSPSSKISPSPIFHSYNFLFVYFIKRLVTRWFKKPSMHSGG